MTRPILLSTSVQNEQFAGITYHLDGELVPMLTLELSGNSNVYFEHHVMMWKNTSVNVSLRPMKGVIKRLFAGMQIFVTQAMGQGQIAFSRDGAGHIVPLHLESGETLEVREHQFLAATGNVDYDFYRVQGVANLLASGSGFFVDRFTANQGEGILWLHGYGNVFEKVLAAGEQMDVEPGAWLYKDVNVRMETAVQNLSSGFFGGSSFIVNRFTGPGRLGLQSMSVVIPQAPGN